MKEKKDAKRENPEATALVPKVTGIGGIFFFSEDTQKTKDWYSIY